MSTCCRLGHSHAAPTITATPIAASSPTTIRAGSGSMGDGPDDKPCEWWWVTRSTVEAVGTCSLLIAGQEVAQSLDRGGKIAGPGQCHEAQVIRGRPIEPGALGDQDLLRQQQVKDKPLVVGDVVDLGVQPRKRIQRTLRLYAGNSRNLVEFRPGDVALLEQSTAGKHQVFDALVASEGDLDRMLRRDIGAQPHVRQQTDALDETAGVVLGPRDCQPTGAVPRDPVGLR